MKKLSMALLAMLSVLGVSTMVRADDQTDYLRMLTIERGQNWYGHAPASVVHQRDQIGPVGAREALLRNALAARVRSEIGDKWVTVAQRIVKVESHYNPRAVGPRTRHGRAIGLGQLLLGSAHALGYQGDADGLKDPATNIIYTVAHMAKCVEAGVLTDGQMAGCHVAGWGNFNSRSTYARAYRVMVARADLTEASWRHTARYARREQYRPAHGAPRDRLAMR